MTFTRSWIACNTRRWAKPCKVGCSRACTPLLAGF